MQTWTRAETITSTPQCSQGASTRSPCSLHNMQPSAAHCRSVHQ
ncbi:MAG: hypothetical protein ACHP91_14185 [Burkholderiales bacterium]